MTKDSLIHLLSIPHVIGLLLQIRSTMKMAVGIVNLFVKPMTATPNYQLNTIINMKKCYALSIRFMPNTKS